MKFSAAQDSQDEICVYYIYKNITVYKCIYVGVSLKTHLKTTCCVFFPCLIQFFWQSFFLDLLVGWTRKIFPKHVSIAQIILFDYRGSIVMVYYIPQVGSFIPYKPV